MGRTVISFSPKEKSYFLFCCYGDSSLAGESTELHRTECLFPQQMHIHYAWCSEKPANAEVSIIELFPLTWLLGTLVCL